MITLRINKKKHHIPEKWEEITLIEFINFHEIIDKCPIKEAILNEFEEEPQKIDIDELQFAKFKEHVFRYWAKTDLPLNAEDVLMCYELLSKFVIGALVIPVDREFEPIREFDFKGGHYDLGGENMQERSYQEYAEIKQAKEKPQILEDYYKEIGLKVNGKKILEGKWSHLPYQIAILTTPGFDEEKIKKRAKLFEELPMDIVWGCAFFLLKQSRKSLADSQYSMLKEAGTLLRQAQMSISSRGGGT